MQLVPLVAAPALLQAENDPRVELVRLQAADRLEEALDAVDGLLDAPIEALDPYGIRYLRGHLLSKLRRTQEAVQAFATVIGSESPLSNYARMRVAELQEELGFTPTAAALATEVLRDSPARDLIPRALTLLSRTLENGGDCRLLERITEVKLKASARRQLGFVRARCLLKREPSEAKQRLATLLGERQSDLVGLLAADLLYPLLERTDPPSMRADLAEAFHHHRRFDLAVPLLLEQVPATLPPIRSQMEFTTHFEMIRGLFWQGQFERAAKGYEQLALRSRLDRHISQALYHRARALELDGRWRESISAYDAAYNAQPNGKQAGPSLLGSLRLHSRSGEEAMALERYKALSSASSYRDERVLGALFLASSSLSASKVKGVRAWLSNAEPYGKTVPSIYWRGRLAELEGKPEEAVEHYLQALERDYFHPLSQLGLERLDQDQLRATALSLGQRFAQSGDRLFETWILLGSQNSEGLAARQRFERHLLHRSRSTQIAPTTAVSIEQWPLWQSTSNDPRELLLSLGIWEESGDAVLNLFPTSQPNLAFTAAGELQRSGRINDGLLIIESLEKRIARGTPGPMVPAVFRRALYPFAYQFLIEQAGRRFKIDPLLLAAIIREESKFQPRAASNAAARGLTQFIIPTAERLAPRIGLDKLTPDLLDQPEISVSLGAAYLQELSQRFGGRAERILAAYNAGEAQTEAWELHCHTKDASEFITKIGFSETRAYVTRVLRSYAQYRDLYPEIASSDNAGYHSLR